MMLLTAQEKRGKTSDRQVDGNPWVIGIACIAWRLGVGQSWARIIWAGTFMLLVTGGAGFIGSNVVAALNDAGRTDIAVCDLLGHDGKWRNLAKRQLADIDRKSVVRERV